MTIEEIKGLKEKAAKEISEILKQFEIATGEEISDISFVRRGLYTEDKVFPYDSTYIVNLKVEI